MKKMDEFKEQMNQKLTRIILNMPIVNLGEIGKKLGKLAKTIQNLNGRFNNGMESSKRCQTDIAEIKNNIEHMCCRNNQCKDRVSDIEDKTVNYTKNSKKENKKTRENCSRYQMTRRLIQV